MTATTVPAHSAATEAAELLQSAEIATLIGELSGYRWQGQAALGG